VKEVRTRLESAKRASRKKRVGGGFWKKRAWVEKTSVEKKTETKRAKKKKTQKKKSQMKNT